MMIANNVTRLLDNRDIDSHWVEIFIGELFDQRNT